MSTFDQLKAEVVFNTFDGAKYLERAGVYINSAARDVARRSAWGAAEVTVPVTDIGQRQGQAVPGLAKITGVWSAGPTGWKQDRFLFAGDAGSPGVQHDTTDDLLGQPTYRVESGDGGTVTVVLSPVPASLQLVVAGFRLPATLEAGTDVVELGPDAEDALILFARAKLYLREDDKEMHDALMASYLDELRRFTLATRGVAEGPRVTPGTWGDGSFGGL